jgi:hypothetical protein
MLKTSFVGLSRMAAIFGGGMKDIVIVGAGKIDP